jgi:RNase adaptor protein for sRNA GlmZ degradation
VLRQTLLQTIPGERHFIRPLRDRADLVVHDPQRSVADVTEQIVRMLGAR